VDECKPLIAGAAKRTAATIIPDQGRAVQLDPIKPTLKPPELKRLKVRYVGSLSNFAFKLDLRRYTKGSYQCGWRMGAGRRQGLTLVPAAAQLSLLCPFQLNLSLLCPPNDPD
jgi:hypothetical protein